MRIILAGGEAWLDTLLSMGVRNTLLSFYYWREQLQRNGIGSSAMLNKMRRAKAKGYRFMLDSGAFTYQMKAAQPGANLPKPQGYFEEYLDFVTQQGDLFDVIVEFDIDGWVPAGDGKAISTEQTNTWINDLLAVPSIAPRVMPVFHLHRGQRWLNDWLEDMRSPLIGISSAFGAGPGPTQVAISQCHRWGKFVHGFAQTRMKTDMKFTNFDSVDSTTWLRADKYGGTMIWENNQLKVLDHLHKADRAKYRGFFDRWGLDYDKVMKDDLETMRLVTITTWREMATYYEAQGLRKNRGKLPYLCEMFKDGKVPAVHPLVLQRQKKANNGEQGTV